MAGPDGEECYILNDKSACESSWYENNLDGGGIKNCKWLYGEDEDDGWCVGDTLRQEVWITKNTDKCNQSSCINPNISPNPSISPSPPHSNTNCSLEQINACHVAAARTDHNYNIDTTQEGDSKCELRNTGLGKLPYCACNNNCRDDQTCSGLWCDQH